MNNKNNKQICEIGKKFDLRFLVLYGSAAIGKLHDESDIDIAYFGNEKLASEQLFNLSSDITDTLRIGYRTLDLVDLKTANLLLRYEITSQGKLLHGDETDYANYRVYSFDSYMDGKSLRTLERTMIDKRQKVLAGVL